LALAAHFAALPGCDSADEPEEAGKAGQAPPPAAKQEGEPAGKQGAKAGKQGAAAGERGYRIVNVVDDFAAYHAAAKDLDAAGRAAKWDEMLESRHRTFFDDAIYRAKTGAERGRYKQWCIGEFWENVAAKMPDILEVSRGINAEIHSTVKAVREKLPDFKPATDYYVTISLSFTGKVLDVGGRKVLALGLENFPVDPGDPQRRITIAHELFHTYHFQWFSASGGLYRMLWAEGLAVYASGVMIPGQRYSNLLDFPVEKMNRCHELLGRMAGELRQNLSSTDKRLRRIYFGAEPNDTEIPPEGGYYVGLLIVAELAKTHTLSEMAKMEPDPVYGTLTRELERLEQGG
jgi:hypothetical protein